MSNTNNQQLRDLVVASGLSQAVALTLFNRGLTTSACTESRWKAYLADPSSPRFVALDDDTLQHAIKVFASVVPKPMPKSITKP